MSNFRLSRADEHTAELPSYLERALTLQAQSRRRLAIFSVDQYIFQDPAWDILLNLFIGHECAIPMSATEACEAAGVSPAAGVRRVDFMERQGWLRQSREQTNHGKGLIGLTSAAMKTMLQYLDAVRGNLHQHMQGRAPPLVNPRQFYARTP